MKTKTQIKQNTKRMLSLLLTAMLLVSTMVVGISTVSAATKKTIYFIKNGNAAGWSKVFAYCWTENSDGTTTENARWTGVEMTDTGKKDEHNNSIYSYVMDNDYVNVIFNPGGDNGKTGNLTIPEDENCYNYSTGRWSSYSELTPVATNLTLTSDNTSIEKGQSATLTATLTGKAVSNVTLTLTGGDTTQTATVSGDETTATFTVSPTRTTTYTVTASAINYSLKSATKTINVVGSDTYYLWTSESDNVTDANAWTHKVLTYSNGSYVGNVIFPKNGQNYYFTINKSPNSVRESSIWLSKKEVKDNLSSTETSGFTSDIEAKDNNGCYFARVSFQKEKTDVKFTFTPEKTVVISRNTSTPVGNVTIKVPNVENAIVTAVANSTTYNEDDSFNIEVGSSFTVNVAGENGYTLNNITYGTQSNTATGASFEAESGVTTFSVAMDQPVPDTVTINVPTVANATVKVTAGGQEYTSGTFDIQAGSLFTVNVTPATGYKFGNISYNSVNYNNGEAITAVKDVTNIAVTVAVDTVNVGFTKLTNATINVSYINDQATSVTAKITAYTTLAMQKGTEFTVTVNPIADCELKSIAYGTATLSENPATFTASADGLVTVTVEQTTPVVETVKVTVPFVENASVAVEYTNNMGAETTTTIMDTNADIVMKKDTDFTVTLNVNSGYRCDRITMTYASLSKSDNPATFTASTNGTLAITAYISQTSTGEATIKFKSARSYMYKVSMSVNGAAATEMTRPDKASTSNDDNFGTSYTGTLTFCWYTQKITVTNGDTTTLSFKTSGTKLNAKVSAKLEAGKTYYFAVDDIAPSSNTEVTAVELPSGNTPSDQMKRNYFHSARHLIYNGTAEDSVLGFTNINNQKYMIGQLLNNSNSADALSVVSATAVQKSVSSVEEYSDLQNTLLDANMNGKLDVKDATLIQKAVVGLV